MRKMLSGFNANTVILMLVSGVLCYMQKQVLEATWQIPALVQQVHGFKDEINLMREELKREEQERKDADRENRQRLMFLEDRAAKQP